MEIVSLIVQQLHAGVISLLAFAPIWLILLNPVTFNVSKCKHLHFGPAHHHDLHYLNGTLIELDTSHSHLGILFDSQLKFHDDYTTQVTTKAN